VRKHKWRKDRQMGKGKGRGCPCAAVAAGGHNSLNSAASHDTAGNGWEDLRPDMSGYVGSSGGMG
jgi:hypothetical protein